MIGDHSRVTRHRKSGDLMVMNHQGRSVFMATLAARMLGYQDPEQAVRAHCKGVVKITTPTAGGAQWVNTISLGDLIRLVMGSRRQDAEVFRAVAVSC
jgi:prophage antirepressor-like protein